MLEYIFLAIVVYILEAEFGICVTFYGLMLFLALSLGGNLETGLVRNLLAYRIVDSNSYILD